jgi:alpha-L-fucosidase
MMALFLACTAAKASQLGGGNLNPTLETDATAMAKWQDGKVGLTIHWGPIASRGTEIGLSRGVQVPAQEYDSLYKEFNPTLFNARDWAQLFKDAGFRYVTLVSKHVDGFAMWDTKQTDYNIVNSAFHRDWLREISDECRHQGIIFGVYYAILDFYQYDYLANTEAPGTSIHGGPGFKLDRKPDFDRYVSYMKAQLKELVQDYGVEILIFDGDWDPSWTHERGSDLYRFLHNLKTTLLINNRVDTKAGWEDARMVGYDGSLWAFNPAKFWQPQTYAGDYLEREEYIGGPAPYPWEAWITLGDQWGWKPNDKNKSADDCIRYLVLTAGGGGNFNLNVTPMMDGRFEKRQKDLLLKIGAWLKANGESIYGTRGGPFEPGLWGASTERANKVYVHVLAWPGETLHLPALNRTVKSARRLGVGEVEWKQSVDGVEISVRPSQRDPVDTIIELTIGDGRM